MASTPSLEENSAEFRHLVICYYLIKFSTIRIHDFNLLRQFPGDIYLNKYTRKGYSIHLGCTLIRIQ